MSRTQLYEDLKKLLPGQFSELIILFGFPIEYQRQNTSHVEKINDLIRYAEQTPDGLEKLEHYLIELKTTQQVCDVKSNLERERENIIGNKFRHRNLLLTIGIVGILMVSVVLWILNIYHDIEEDKVVQEKLPIEKSDTLSTKGADSPIVSGTKGSVEINYSSDHGDRK